MDLLFKKMADHSHVDLCSYAMAVYASNPSIKVYVGSDSQNYSTSTMYATTVVFRYENNGAHVIYHRESTKIIRDLWTRLWGELQRSIEVAGILRHDCRLPIEQIDLDLNSNPLYPSNKVVQAAMGYTQSMGYMAKTKPDMLPATWAANILVN